MTTAQAIKQMNDYRAAAKDYAAKGDKFVSDRLLSLADGIEAVLIAERAL